MRQLCWGYSDKLDVRDIEMDHGARAWVINNYYFWCDPDEFMRIER